MKRILFTLMLFAVVIQAQTYIPQKADIKNPAVYSHQASGDTLAPIVYVINPITGTFSLPTGASTAANQTNGSQKAKIVNTAGTILGDTGSPFLTTPDYAYIRSSDTWGAAADTSTYDFLNRYLKCYVTIYDSSATADTLTFEHYNHAKLGWTTQAISLRDVLTDYLEVDNTTVIIPANTTKTLEINIFRPGQLRFRPKTVVGRTVYKTKRTVWTGNN